LRRSRKKDPAIEALYRERIERVGLEQGYKTFLCPCCGKFLWAKAEAEIVDPRTLEGDALRRVANEHRKRYPTMDLPDDVSVPYRERVQELGRERGYESTQCPHCSRPLWTNAKILKAKL
jgi:RNase P subunit RPR2